MPQSNFRLPFTLPDDVHQSVKDGFRLLFNALTDHDQAITALKTQLTATQTVATTAATTATQATTAVAAVTPKVSALASTPSAGGVNDQTGATSYILQQSDYGGLVIFNSGSAISVTANTGVSKPFFTKIWNNGAGTITVAVGDFGGTPTGDKINGATNVTIAPGVTKSVYANSSDINWSAA